MFNYKITHNGVDILNERMKATQKLSAFFIFDIQTIPDEEMVQLVGNEKDKNILAGMNGSDEALSGQNGFLQPHFHKVISVSTLIVKKETDGEHIFDFDPAYGSELDLLKHFWMRFQKAMCVEKKNSSLFVVKHFPCFITFNGKNFDMPVITARTMKYADSLNNGDRVRIALYHDNFDVWENNVPNYRHKFSKYHLDLYQEITGAYISLAAACYLAGISVMTRMNGNSVFDAYRKQHYKEVAEHCAENTLATAKLFAVLNETFWGQRYNFPHKQEFEGLMPKLEQLSNQN